MGRAVREGGNLGDRGGYQWSNLGHSASKEIAEKTRRLLRGGGWIASGHRRHLGGTE